LIPTTGPPAPTSATMTIAKAKIASMKIVQMMMMTKMKTMTTNAGPPLRLELSR
jgi:phosphoglucomutase